MHTSHNNIDYNFGQYIKVQREKIGLSQSQVGELVGLNKNEVDNIEKGDSVSPYVAGFILEKLGAQNEIKLVKQDKHSDDDIAFIMDSVIHFSKEKDISLAKAFQYLNIFKGLDFLIEFKELEQLLAPKEIVDDLVRVCANNGGLIK